MAQNQTEMFDFLFDRDDCKVEDNNLSSLFFNNDEQVRSLKEELFANDLPFELKSETIDFDVEDLLGSYFADDFGVSSSSQQQQSREGRRAVMDIKAEDDFEPFKDMASLPFDAVMDSSFDAAVEAASDSGLSADNLADVMLSPCSGATSPEPRGDVSTDTMDTVSEVSSTSDLGSMASVGAVSPTGSTSGGVDSSSSAPNSFEGSLSCGSEATSAWLKTTTVTLPSSTLKTSKTSSSSGTKGVALTPTTPTNGVGGPGLGGAFTSIATRSVKVDLSSSRVVKASAASAVTRQQPLLTRVRLNSTSKASSGVGGVVGGPTAPTIVVTQASKGAATTLLKTSSGRPILLPVTVGDLSQVKTIKIISAGSATAAAAASSGVRTLVSTVRPVSTSNGGTRMVSTSNGGGTRTTFYTTSKGSDGRSLLKVTPTAFVTPNAARGAQTQAQDSFFRDDALSDEETPQPNQELVLTDEEKKLMRKEGLVLPPRYPLTKQEERDLKRIRRKIRNKISAQDSRKRKKEYVDGLEDRVKNCTEENQQLQKRIKTLEKQNETLVAQLKRFQALVGSSLQHSRPHTHASTALMMLILSAALFVVPSLRSQSPDGSAELANNGKMPSAGHSRSLLEALPPAPPPSADDDVEMDAFSGALSDHDYAPLATKQRRVAAPPAGPLFASVGGVDKLGLDAGKPPDGVAGMNAVSALVGAMLERLGANWTDPGSFGALGNRSASLIAAGDRLPSAVVVNLNQGGGRRLRDDIELE